MLNKNRILILGINGYIGLALWRYLLSKHYEVFGIDNDMRERNVVNIGSSSLTKNGDVKNFKLDISLEYKSLKEIISGLKPATIINLAQQPSAPFSMIDAEHAIDTQRNNVCGGLNVLWAVKEIDPEIHIIQLGTAGEYPDWLYDGIEVPESSRINVKYQDKDWEIPTPRYFGSWYHASKMYSSYNADYASRIWGLKITDINQGIVYGHRDGTRLDYDQYFGTVINRFVVQAIAGIPLTIYGKSGGQSRSFININNSIQAIELLIRNPAESGEYRIIQQLTEVHRIIDIANKIKELTNCEIQFVNNPRSERDENEFKFEASKLKTLGLETIGLYAELPGLIDTVRQNKDNIKKEVIMPTTNWK